MTFDLSIGAGASAAVEYMLDNYSPALDAIADGIGFFADGIKDGLLWLPSWAFIAVVALVALWRTGWNSAVTFVLALSLIVGMGLWKETVETLALVIAASAISVSIGIPLGILTARSALLAAGTRPLLDLMQKDEVDWTGAFRSLSNAVRGDDTPFWSLFEDRAAADQWLSTWRTRLGREKDDPGRVDRMDRENPLYIPRNHLVEEALAAAIREDDLGPFDALHEVLSRPYADQGPSRERYTQPAPWDGRIYRTFCGT